MNDQDLRGSIRHRTLKGGRIAINEGHSTINCMVRNMSDAGALLRVASVIGIPDSFELVLDDGRTFDCTVAHKSATDIGVSFS